MINQNETVSTCGDLSRVLGVPGPPPVHTQTAAGRVITAAAIASDAPYPRQVRVARVGSEPGGRCKKS